MVQFADSVVIIPDGFDPYTLPVHPDGTYVDDAESISAASMSLDGIGNDDNAFQDALQGEKSMRDFGADGVDFWDSMEDQSLGDAMAFSDDDFSSVSSGSEGTLEKEPPESSSDSAIIKQIGLKAGVSGALGLAAPALMKYSSRVLNGSTEVEDMANDSAILSASFNNSATFSHVAGAAQGTFAMQHEVSKIVMQRAMVLAARSASKSVGQGSVALTSAATGVGGAAATGAIGGAFGIGIKALIVTAITTSIIAGGLMGLEAGGVFTSQTKTESFLPLNISFADFDDVPSPSLVPSLSFFPSPSRPSSGMISASPSSSSDAAQSMSPSARPGEFFVSLSNEPSISGSLRPTQLSSESVSIASSSPSVSRLQDTMAPSFLVPTTLLASAVPVSSLPTQLPSESESQASSRPSPSRLQNTNIPTSPLLPFPTESTSTTPTVPESTAIPTLSQSGDPSIFISPTEPTDFSSRVPSASPPGISSASPTLFSSVPQPTGSPTEFLLIEFPSKEPSPIPSTGSDSPSRISSNIPVVAPSNEPSPAPNFVTAMPSLVPSEYSVISPSNGPSPTPSTGTDSPSRIPSNIPVVAPSNEPSPTPSFVIDMPSLVPSEYSIVSPSKGPSPTPSTSTNSPSRIPSNTPLVAPSNEPSPTPSFVTDMPSLVPSEYSVVSPSKGPSPTPSIVTDTPSLIPSGYPFGSPSESSGIPTVKPSQLASQFPTTRPPALPTTEIPSMSPSNADQASSFPSQATVPTSFPSTSLMPAATLSPSAILSSSPSLGRSAIPTNNPTESEESPSPSSLSSIITSPSTSPSPTAPPTVMASASPTGNPTTIPTSSPTIAPTSDPTSFPSPSPTSAPTNNPTTFSSSPPTSAPTDNPTSYPSPSPTIAPTNIPTILVSSSPTSEAPPSGPTSPGTVGKIFGWRLVWSNNTYIADLMSGDTVDLCDYGSSITIEAMVDRTNGPVEAIVFQVKNAAGGGSRRVKDNTDPFQIGNAYAGWSSIVIGATPFPDPQNEGNRGDEVLFPLNFVTDC